MISLISWIILCYLMYPYMFHGDFRQTARTAMRLYKGLAIRLGGSIFVVPRCKLARSGHWVSTGYRDISKTSLLHMDDRSSWELYWPIQRGSPPLRHLFRCPSARGVEISSLDNGSSCCSGIRHVCAPVVDGHCHREHREVLGGYLRYTARYFL